MSVILDLEKHLTEIMPDNERLEYIAFMGNGAGTVKAKGTNNVYVIRHDRSISIVRNTRVPNVAKLQVVVGYDSSNPTLLQVLRTVNAYLDPPYPSVASHAELMHGAWKYDPVWVTNDQIIPGLVTPATTYGLIAQLRGFVYYLDGWHLLDNQQIDFSEHIPEAGARWVVADIDSTGVITLRDGDIKASREVLLPEDIPLVLSDKKSLFAVRCYAGQTMIVYLEKKMRDIFDMRFAGVASGGTASSVAWDDVTGKPDVFPPDTDVTDPRYPRKWMKSGAPNTTHDAANGYGKSDIWVDQTADAVYICADNTDGAAIWIQVATGTGGGGGGGVTCFNVDGRLAVVDNAASPILITADTTITEWRLYLEELGTSGSTILDVILVRVGDTNTSIFDDGVTDNRPEIAFDDTDHLIAATPLITDFLAGDVLLLNIDQIAPLAGGAVLGAVSSGGGGAGSSLTVTDGITEVNSVSKITFENAVVTDAGTGEALVVVGKFIQCVESQSGAVATGTTTIPFDDTKPQNTEGDEYLTCSITPTNAGNDLYIEANVFLSPSVEHWVAMAIFQDSNADAISCALQYLNGATTGKMFTILYKMAAGTTSLTTFKIRAGIAGAGTLTMNGQSGGRLFGGALVSSLKITEVKP